MNRSERLKLLLVLTTLLIITGCTSQPKLNFVTQNPGSGQEAHWVKLEGLPDFNPEKHSDGCSGGMSAAYAELTTFHVKHGNILPWRHCCVTHDKAYYYGGSMKEKKDADETLEKCVNHNQGGGALGAIMENAVTVGGQPYIPTSYRWGYGDDYRITQNYVK